MKGAVAGAAAGAGAVEAVVAAGAAVGVEVVMQGMRGVLCGGSRNMGAGAEEEARRVGGGAMATTMTSD